MSTTKRIAVFDLDGTLLDTIRDLASALNRALAAHGLKERTVAEVRRFIGNGALMLVSRASGLPPESGECRSLRADFTREYRAHLADETKPYPGISELVHTLSAAGVFVAVVSNKDDGCVRQLVELFFKDDVKAARGVREESERKPNPAPTLELLSSHGFKPDEAVYIGDGRADFELARSCGIDHVPVSYGYTDPEALAALCRVAPLADVSSLEARLREVFGIA